MMTRDHVIWAGALWVEKHFGQEAPRFINQQIGSLVVKDDIVGVEMWQKIAAAYEQLLDEEVDD
jgi:hypothetical protein